MSLLCQTGSVRLFTRPTLNLIPRYFSTTSVGMKDDRPASAHQFTPAQVSAGISALAQAGYDPETVWEQRVCWGDHDQFQHVNNVHFVRWFESARMFFATSLTKDLSPERKEEIAKGTGKSFILAGINVRYRRPVVYPDTVSPLFIYRQKVYKKAKPKTFLSLDQILVGTACELPLGKDRFMLRGACYSLAQQSIVAVSAQDSVSYDYTQLKKCDIPDDLKQALEARGSHFDKKL